MSKMITLMMDGRIPVEVDEDEFELIKMMVEEVGAKDDFSKLKVVIDDLVGQGYKRPRAMQLAVMSRHRLKGEA